MMFWILLTLLAVVAAWFIVLPTLKAKPSEDTRRQALNAKIFKQRMEELETDYQSGRTDQEDYDALKTELERNFLADMEQAEKGALQSGQTSKGLLIGLLVVLPLVALLVYKQTGYQDTIGDWMAVQEQISPYIDRMVSGDLKPEELRDIPMADFVYVLQRRAQNEGDLARLWFVLGNTFLQVDTRDVANQAAMMDSAAKALRRAHYLEEDNVEYSLAYIQALLAVNKGQLDIESRKILNEVLSQQPNNPSAIMMLAMASYQSGDYQTAINGWERLLAMGSKSGGHDKAQSILENSIRQAKIKLLEQQGAEPENQLKVSVNLADSVTANMRTGFLMVYAQAEAGPPMPLAIKKLSLPQQFPVTVSLSDDDAMMPSMKVSLFETVKVTARLSETGQAVPQTGDWFGTTKGISTVDNTGTTDIVINERVSLP